MHHSCQYDQNIPSIQPPPPWKYIQKLFQFSVYRFYWFSLSLRSPFSYLLNKNHSAKTHKGLQAVFLDFFPGDWTIICCKVARCHFFSLLNCKFHGFTSFFGFIFFVCTSHLVVMLSPFVVWVSQGYGGRCSVDISACNFHWSLHSTTPFM